MTDTLLTPKVLRGRVTVLKDQIAKTRTTDETLSILTSQLNLETVTPLRPKDFWNQLSSVTKQLSKECTKVAISYSKPPLPSGAEANSLLQNVETAAVALCSIYFSAFPTANSTIGLTCWAGVRRWTSSVLGSLQNFLETLPKGPQHVQQLLSGTGAVWEVCDSLSNLPTNNQIAVRNSASESLGMVDDALSELKDETAENDDDEMDENLNQVLNSLYGIAKTAKATLRTIKSLFSSVSSEPVDLPAGTIADLDILAESIEEFSPGIDDLAGAFYELSAENSARPLIVEAGNTKKMIQGCLQILRNSQSLSIEKGTTDKIEFIQKALDHNYAKFSDSISCFS